MSDTSTYDAVKALPESEKTRLVVDAGGSTLRVAEFDLEGRQIAVEHYVLPEERFSNMDAGVARFVSKLGHRPMVGVVGAAGPIDEAVRVKLTNNATWPAFDTREFERQTGIRLQLFNDLVVAAACLDVLAPSDTRLIRGGRAEADGPKLAVTLSTGLNDSLAMPKRFGGLRYVAGESGHVPFAPRNETEQELLGWAWKRGATYVSFEDVMSGGNGFELLFEFVTRHLAIAPLQSTIEALHSSAQKGPAISDAALVDDDPAALRVLQLAGAITGSYLAMRAISTMASGGIFLVGSIAAHVPLMNHYIEETSFLRRFDEAGPITDFVRNVPISCIINPEYSLIGAAEIARHAL